MERINLIRSTPFNRLPSMIQDNLRNCFRLKENEFIDLRNAIIKSLEHDILSMDSTANLDDIHCGVITDKESKEIKDPATQWLYGSGPKQQDIISALRKRKQKLEKSKLPDNLEEGEISDEEGDDDNDLKKKMQRRMALKKRARSQMANDSGGSEQEFRNRNSNKNFETQRTKKKKLEDDFHCGLESYQYVKSKEENENKMEEDGNDESERKEIDEEGDG